MTVTHLLRHVCIERELACHTRAGECSVMGRDTVWIFPSSALLRGEGWFETDVSGLPIIPS